jgi:hypothetical protein
MEGALAELRDLEWRAKAEGRSLATSPYAKDIPARLIQHEAGDYEGGHYSDMLVTDRAGREVIERKRDTPRPRSPLSTAEVARYEELLVWLDMLRQRVSALDKDIVWEAAWHLWRGEPHDWVRVKQATGYRSSTQALAKRYHLAVCKLICAVNGVPLRHAKGLLVRTGGGAAGLSPLEGRGNA